jgi:hypothetical protein
MRAIGTNEATRYEIVATNGARTILVGYAARKNQRGLIDMLTQTVDDIAMMRLHRLARATGTAPSSWEAFARTPEIKSGDWTVTFSGRTQREVRTLGERTESIYQEQYDA